MLSLQALRQDPDSAKAALAKRDKDGYAPVVDQLLTVDEERRRTIAEVEELKFRRNEVSKKIGDLKRQGEDAEAPILEMRSVGKRIAELDASLSAADEEIRDLLLNLPNLPHAEVPSGGKSTIS